MERWALLVGLRSLFTPVLDFLSFVWLLLTVLELTRGLAPGAERFVTFIWILFGIHFGVELVVAPRKLTYLRHNWLTATSLLLPAVRMVKLFRVARFFRTASLVKVLSSFNRGMRVLRRTIGNRAFPYVLALSLVVIVSGAAGVSALEKGHTEYFDDFPAALWWASMMVTTMGSDYFPKSGEGRLLALLLAVYGFAIFGYVTASVASALLRDEKDPPLRRADLEKLEVELRELRTMLGRGVSGAAPKSPELAAHPTEEAQQ